MRLPAAAVLMVFTACAGDASAPNKTAASDRVSSICVT